MASGLPTGVEDLGTQRTISLTYKLTNSHTDKIYTLEGSSAFGVTGYWCYRYYKLKLDGYDFELKSEEDLEINFDYDSDDDMTSMNFPSTITFTKCPINTIIVDVYIISGGFNSATIYNDTDTLYLTANSFRGNNNISLSTFFNDTNYFNAGETDLNEFYCDYIPLSTSSTSGIGIYGIYYNTFIVDFDDTTTTIKYIDIKIPEDSYNSITNSRPNVFISSSDECIEWDLGMDSQYKYSDMYSDYEDKGIFKLKITRYSSTGTFDKTYLTLHILWLTGVNKV